jgi:streptogramin lyase
MLRFFRNICSKRSFAHDRWPLSVASELWFAETGAMGGTALDAVAEITADGAATVISDPLPMVESNPIAVALGPDGNVWFSENAAGDARNITAEGLISAPAAASTATAMPTGIVTGPDGNLWMAETGVDKIAQIIPAGVVTEFPVPTGSEPLDLAIGNDGKLYFTEWESSNIGRMLITASGGNSPGYVDGQFSTPTGNANPNGIVLGPDCNIWFTETNSGYVGTVDNIGTPGHISEYLLPTSESQPVGIAVGPDGNLWIAESAADQLAVLSPASGWSTIACAGLELPAIAKCQDGAVTLPTDLNQCSAAPAEVQAAIDDGSSDPNNPAGTPSEAISPAPTAGFTPGATTVALLVSPGARPSGAPGVSAAQARPVSACHVSVTVKDEQKPSITCPSPLVVQCTGDGAAQATFAPTASDNCPGLAAPVCSPASATSFSLGQTGVTCSVNDAAGNSKSCVTSVTVQDTIKPVITSVTATPSSIPPTSKNVATTIAASATDTCDPNAPVCTVTGISGGTASVTGPLRVSVLAQSGLLASRTYTVSVKCADEANNIATGQTTIQVESAAAASITTAVNVIKKLL